MACCNLLYPSHVHIKLTSRKISFAKNFFVSCPIATFCSKHRTAVIPPCCVPHFKTIDSFQMPLAACRESAGKLWELCKVLYVLNRKRNIMLHIPALWYFDTSVTYPQRFRWVKFVLIVPRFVQQQYLWNIAIQPPVGCYNSWTNIRCSDCSPLGEISLWNGTFGMDPRANKISGHWNLGFRGMSEGFSRFYVTNALYRWRYSHWQPVLQNEKRAKRLTTLDISRYNIAWYCTRRNKCEGKTAVRLGTHKRQP